MKQDLPIGNRYRARSNLMIFTGDCVEFLRSLPAASAQLVVTSPPYNVGKEYEKSITVDKYLEAQRSVIAECVRILRPGGSICWQVGIHVNGHRQLIPLDILLYPLFATYAVTDELRLRNRIVWHYEHGLNCTYRFSGRHETVLWFTKGDQYVFNLDWVRVPQKYPGKKAFKGILAGAYTSHPLGKNPGDVWILPNVKANHVEKTVHPCQFPLELVERLILALSMPGDLVVDPYLGSGTTAVAAAFHGRRVAGAEIEGRYVKLAKQRLRQLANGTLRRRPLGKPIYKPKPNTPLTTNPFQPDNGKSELSR